MRIKTVGIDLGTTYSVVGIFKNGKVDIIANSHGNRTTPSLVSFNDEVRLVGDAAKKQTNLNPVNSISNVKRLIGQKFHNPEVQKDIKQWSHKVVCIKENTPMLEVEYQKEARLFSPEQVSAMILENLKGTAEHFLGYTVKQAVITVPAYFNDSQRQATKDAGKIAGFKAIKILNEPTAAAIAYGFDKIKEGRRNILVYDLGGGTFDVTVLVIDNGQFTVKSTAGDVHLGGEDFDNQLVNYFSRDIMKNFGIEIRQDPKAFRRLRTACEKAKRNLSYETDTKISLDTLIDKKDYIKTINRSRFEKMCDELFKRTLEIVEDALEESGMNKYEIDDVVLVGGSTSIPKIRSMLSEFFHGKQLSYGINADEAVAIGATIYAEMLLSRTGSESARQLKLNDVIPLSLGIEISGGLMSTLIRRNTTIPMSQTRVYTTEEDGQSNVEIQVYEGESEVTSENNLLGRFQLSGISNTVKGESEIAVTFSVDTDGILEIMAVDMMNGSMESININKRKGRLSNKKINRMIIEERVYKAREELQKLTDCAKDRLGNLLDDMESYIEDEKIMLKIKPTEWKMIVDTKRATSDWFDTKAGSATKQELEELYNHLKEQCKCLEIAIGKEL